MRSRSRSTFHASSTGTSTRKLSSIFTGPPAAVVRDLRGCRRRRRSRCRCSRSRTARSRGERPGAHVAAELHRLGPEATRQLDRVARLRRRRWGSTSSPPVAADPPVRLGADQRLVGQADAHRVDVGHRRQGASSTARRLDAIPSSHSGFSTTVHVVAPVERGADLVAAVADDDHARARARTPSAASTAHATSGRPRHSSSGFDASPPRRDPRPAARIATAALNRRGPDRRARGDAHDDALVAHHRGAVVVPVGVLAAESCGSSRPAAPSRRAATRPRRCRRPGSSRRRTRRTARTATTRGSRRRFFVFIAVSRVLTTMRPSASTLHAIGDICGEPSRRYVSITAWWCSRTKSSARRAPCP